MALDDSSEMSVHGSASKGRAFLLVLNSQNTLETKLHEQSELLGCVILAGISYFAPFCFIF